jgi:hypothetical protein
MKDFIEGYQAGEKIIGDREKRKLERERYGAPSDKDTDPYPGITPGSTAIPEASPGTDPSKTGAVDNDTSEIAGRLKGDLMRDFGLNDIEAGGIVASLAAESGGFKQLQELAPTIPGTQGGWGYAQWTGPRRVAFAHWAQEQGFDPKSYAANYGFLKHELQNTDEGKILDQLRGAKTIRDATRIFTGSAADKTGFLRPGKVNLGGRYSWADKIAGIAPIKRDYGPAMPEKPAAAAATEKPATEEPTLDTSKDETQQSADATPLSPDAGVAIPEPEQVAFAPTLVQPEEEWMQGTTFAQTGGVLPEPQRFQTGGQPVVPPGNPANPSNVGGVDKYSRFRNYTQQIVPSPKPTFTPRRVGQAPAGAAAATGLQLVNGLTPSQLAFKQAQDRLAAQQAKPKPVAAAPAPAVPAARPRAPQLPSAYSEAGYYAGNATRGRSGVPHQSAAWQNYEQQLSAWRNANPGRFQEGGVIPEPTQSFQRGGHVSREEFNRLVHEEERRGSAGRSTGDTARDAVARRLNIRERGVSSTAYGGDYWKQTPRRAAPKPRSGGGGGVKLPRKAPRPEPRPDETTSSTTPDITPQAATGVTVPSPIPPQAATGVTQPSPIPPQAATGVTQPSPITPQAATGVTVPSPGPTEPYLGVSGRTTAPVIPDLPPPVVPETDPQKVLGEPTAAQKVSRDMQTGRQGRIVPKGDEARFYDPNGNPLPLDANGEPIPRDRAMRPIFDPQGHITGYEVIGPDRSDKAAQKDFYGFQEGGVIPEPGMGEQWRGGSPGVQAAPVSDETTGSIDDAERKHRYKPTPLLLDHVAQALDGGVRFLTRAFGLGQDGAIATPEGNQASADGARRFAEGEGATTPDEINGIDDKVDPDRQMAEGDRQMQRIAKTVQWYLAHGRKDDAEAAAAGLMQYGAQRTAQLGSLAAAAYKQYLASNDPRHLENTTHLLEKAYEMIPDGGSLDVAIDPETRQLVVSKVNENGETENVPITAEQLPGIIQGVQNKSLYWQQIMQLADPEGYRAKQRQGAESEEWTRRHELETKEGLEKETREETRARGEEERKAQRELEKEKRESETKIAEAKAKAEAELAKEGRESKENDRRRLRDAAITRAEKLAETRKDVNWDTVNPLMGAAADAVASEDQDQINDKLSRLWDALPQADRAKTFSDLGYDASQFKYKAPAANAMARVGDKPPTEYAGKQAGDVVKPGKDRQGNPIWVVSRNGENFAISAQE